MKHFYHLMELLQDWGVAEQHAEWATRITILLGVALISFIFTKVIYKVIIPIIHRLTARTKATWDENILNDNVIKSIDVFRFSDMKMLACYNYIPHKNISTSVISSKYDEIAAKRYKHYGV